MNIEHKPIFISVEDALINVRDVSCVRVEDETLKVHFISDPDAPFSQDYDTSEGAVDARDLIWKQLDDAGLMARNETPPEAA